MTAIRFQERPLLAVLILAAIPRLVAAVFSRGFLAIDDHHVLVDAADRLGGPGLDTGFMRSIPYPGMVALIMRATRAIDDPSPATQFFVLPITSVHQFEEAVCQVPLLASAWWILKAPGVRRDTVLALLSGTALGLALVVRFPLITFVVPFALWVVWREPFRWRGAAFLAGITVVLALQGWSNQLVNHEWGYSFQRYYGPLLHFPPRILTQSEGYPHGAPWTYAAVLLVAFLPPFSLVLFAAAARGGTELPLLGVPTLVFLVAQSVIANRQERFLLPVLPVLLVLATLGFDSVAAWFARHSRTRLYTGLWKYYWSVPADTRLLEHALGARLASLTAVRPSLGDRLAHVINPGHNHATEAVVLSVTRLTGAPP